jgi:hypothetical protein
MTQNFFTLTIGGRLLCQPQLCCMILQTHQVVLTLFCFGHHSTSFTSQKKPPTLGTLSMEWNPCSTSHSPYISSLMLNNWGTKHHKGFSVRMNMHEYNAQQYAHDSVTILHQCPIFQTCLLTYSWLVAKIQDLGRECLDHLQQNFLCERQSLSYDHSVSTINILMQNEQNFSLAQVIFPSLPYVVYILFPF